MSARGEDLGEPFGGADRDGGLADDQVAGGDVRKERVDGCVDVREVGGDLAVELRRAHADEVQLRRPLTSAMSLENVSRPVASASASSSGRPGS